MSRFGGGGAVAMPVLALTINASQTTIYNIATAAGVAVATRIVLTLNPSFKVRGITTGSLPAGSELLFINKGVVYGLGGAGGLGAGGTNGSNGAAAFIQSSSSGLVLFEINNAAGYIFGGGGGGKGAGGGGGGGGAGNGPGGAGTGGTAGSGHAGQVPTWTGATWTNLSNAGGRGGMTILGGLLEVAPQLGHNGTDWGTAGLSGDGTPGKAIELNGGVSPTWLSGNVAARVKGAVS